MPYACSMAEYRPELSQEPTRDVDLRNLARQNRPHAHRPCETTPAQDHYIWINHLCGHLWPATTSTDGTVGLLNKHDFASNCSKTTDGRQSPCTLSSTSIGSHPCWTMTTTCLGQEAHPLKDGRECSFQLHQADGRQRCMPLLVIRMLSDTTIRCCGRSSYPAFARTTPLSSTTMPDLTLTACAGNFWIAETSACLIRQHIPLVCTQ